MVETIMFFAGGFLVASLLALVLISFVHHRAVRLTQRRLEDAIPVSMAEIQADKDNLRAGFAMSARRLEMNVEQLKAKATTQLSEIARKTEAINRLKAELIEKTAITDALDAQAKSLAGKIRETEQEYDVKVAAVEANERALAAKEAELAKAASEINEQRAASEAQRLEVATLKSWVEQFKGQVGALQQEAQDTARRLFEERITAGTVARELEEKRQAVDTLRPQLAQLEREIAAYTNELENRGRRIDELEQRVSAQAQTLAEREAALSELRQQRDGEVAALHQRRESEIAALRQERDAAVAALRQELAADRANYGSRIAGLQDNNSTLERLLAEANNTITAHSARVDDLEQWLAERDRTINLRDAAAQALQDEHSAAKRQSDAEIERRQADINSLERLLQVANHTLEVRDGRVADLENALAERDELLRQCDAEIKGLLEEVATLKGEVATAGVRLGAETGKLEALLQAAIEDRRRTQLELAALTHEAEATWKTERVENALLRERINDIAAQVAHMAMAMDKSGSIEAILAQSARTEDSTNGAEETSRPGDLTARIRKLQHAASRAAPAS